MAAIPLPPSGQTGLPTTLVAPTMVGATLPVITPPTQVEVAAVMVDGSRPSATAAVPEAPARPTPLVSQAMAPGMGQKEGDVPEGSSGVVVVAERSAVLGTGRESSLVLTSVGSDLPTWGEPLLRWTNP